MGKTGTKADEHARMRWVKQLKANGRMKEGLHKDNPRPSSKGVSPHVWR
jgi:hypothetical protein